MRTGILKNEHGLRTRSANAECENGLELGACERGVRKMTAKMDWN